MTSGGRDEGRTLRRHWTWRMKWSTVRVSERGVMKRMGFEGHGSKLPRDRLKDQAPLTAKQRRQQC